MDGPDQMWNESSASWPAFTWEAQEQQQQPEETVSPISSFANNSEQEDAYFSQLLQPDTTLSFDDQPLILDPFVWPTPPHTPTQQLSANYGQDCEHLYQQGPSGQVSVMDISSQGFIDPALWTPAPASASTPSRYQTPDIKAEAFPSPYPPSQPNELTLDNGTGETDREWTYAVQVWPAIPREEFKFHSNLADHAAALDSALKDKNIDFSVRLERSSRGGITDFCRNYILSHQLRDHNRARLDFFFCFQPGRNHNRNIQGYRHEMSVVQLYGSEKGLLQPDGLYSSSVNDNSRHDSTNGLSSTPRRHQNEISISNNHLGNGRYSPLGDLHDIEAFNNDSPGILDPVSPTSSIPFLGPPTPEDGLSLQPFAKADSNPTGTAAPPRMKPIPKPDRQVLKTRDGKFRCTFPGCSEDVQEFARKCEWSKHMDKHDRPYKCPAGGCEKLPGFTYSGGLLRHEREVHGKHGGPKNPLNCPHVNCKRHDGKGFSRLENLNEHLRRVHTSTSLAPIGTSTTATSEDHEDSVSVTSDKVGEKRKAPTDDEDLREENKRLRSDLQAAQSRVQDLENAIAARDTMSMAMMTELRTLRERQPQPQSQSQSSHQMSSFTPGRLPSGDILGGDSSDDAVLSLPSL